MGGGLSSIFYPDNPNRRARAEQLLNDVEAQKAIYEGLYAQYEQVIRNTQTQVDLVLRALGFHTIDDLQARILQLTSGATQQQWREMFAAIDRRNQTSTTTFEIFGISFTAGAIAIKVLTKLAVLTVATKGLLLPFLIAFVVIVAAFGLIWAIIAGAVQRSRYREAIRDLHANRIEAVQAVQQMRAILLWATEIARSFDRIARLSPNLTPEQIAAELAKDERTHNTLQNDYEHWNLWNSANQAAQLDRNRQSWTREDPSIQQSINNINNRARSFSENPAYTDEPPVSMLLISPANGMLFMGAPIMLCSLVDQTADNAGSCTFAISNTFVAQTNNAFGLVPQVNHADQFDFVVTRDEQHQKTVVVTHRASGRFVSNLDGQLTADNNRAIWLARRAN